MRDGDIETSLDEWLESGTDVEGHFSKESDVNTLQRGAGLTGHPGGYEAQ
jgi:hypothetical protein